MTALRISSWALVAVALCGAGTRARAGGSPVADQRILEQAANAMVFQATFADMALALSRDGGVLELAHHIRNLSQRGLAGIEAMAAECGVKLEAHLDATAWRRVGALREISTPHLRDQVYLDAQLMRLYEARQENLEAGVRAEHAIVKAFALRSEPEIEALIVMVRGVVAETASSRSE